MTFDSENTRHMPHLSIDVEAIASHLNMLSEAESCCLACGTDVTMVASEAAHLIIEINRLYAALRTTRLEAANLRAAIRAALGAHADGEADPLGYLRDEIAEIDAPDSGWRL